MMYRSSSGETNVRRISQNVSSALGCGSGVMANYKAHRNVWGAEEAFLSPPGGSGTLAGYLDSEESSEDCEDYVCDLAEEIAKSMLQDEEAPADEEAFQTDSWPRPASGAHKMSSSPTSPQSILTAFSWESQSSKASSGMTSPPTPHEGREAADVLYGDLLRLELEDQVDRAAQQRQMLLREVVQRPAAGTRFGYEKQSRAPSRVQRTSSTQSMGRSSGGQAGRDNLLSLAIDRAMMVRQTRHQRTRGSNSSQVGAASAGSPVAQGGRKGTGGSGRRVSRSGAEQHVQQHFSLFARNEGAGGPQAEGGLRAVFLGANNSRECEGTGVFLPRRYGSAHHQSSRRKPAVSTVLLPPHIVQALNLNVEDTLPSSHPRVADMSTSGYVSYHHYVPPGCYMQELREERPTGPLLLSLPTTLQEIAPNISLPSEWTY